MQIFFTTFAVCATLLQSSVAAPTTLSTSLTISRATSREPSIPESVLNATAAGIDVHGPIPEDYTRKEGAIYHFAAGSNASTWARAQLDLESYSKLHKRVSLFSPCLFQARH